MGKRQAFKLLKLLNETSHRYTQVHDYFGEFQLLKKFLNS